jgi:hypothetical protein
LAFEVEGALPVLAASSRPDQMVLIVPSMSANERMVQFDFVGGEGGVWKISAPITFITADDAQLRWPRINELNHSGAKSSLGTAISIILNDQQARPGSRWEIAVVKLRRVP